MKTIKTKRKTECGISNKLLSIINIGIAIAIAIILIPIFINECYKVGGYITLWDAGDVLAYFGTVLSFIGTVTVAVVAFKQNERVVKLEEKNSSLEMMKYIPFVSIEDAQIINREKDQLIISIKNVSEIPIKRIKILTNPPQLWILEEDKKYHGLIYMSTMDMSKEEYKVMGEGGIEKISFKIYKEDLETEKCFVDIAIEVEGIYDISRFQRLKVEFIRQNEEFILANRSEYFYDTEEQMMHHLGK